MKHPSPCEQKNTRPPATRSLDGTPSRTGAITSWAVFLTGLTIWTIVQCSLTYIPFSNRSLPPEVDDSLAFLVRTQEMEECFFQDCPALQDLRAQRELQVSDPRVLRAHDLSSFPFPIYHPGFSLLVLGAKALVGDLTTAYKLLWVVSPLFFGIAFACLLTAFWGRSAAGITLTLLAFKVFPDTGIHYFTPANLAMGLAVLVWARIVTQRGDAPWTLTVGSTLLLLVHPIGGVYALMSVAFALVTPREGSRRRLFWSLIGVFILLVLAAFLASSIRKPAVLNIFGNLLALPSMEEVFSACFSNLEGIFANISRLKDSLLGQPPLLLLGITIGLFLSGLETKKLFIRVTLAYGVFLVFSIFHRHVASPLGDLFFRLWIPLVVIAFGAMGTALARLGSDSWRLLRESLGGDPSSPQPSLQRILPAVLFALLAGYSADAALSGGEHIAATIEYMRNRQPLRFERSQVQTLLSQAAPGDRVLYTGAMPMAFYFVHGAMQLGAVYYHPAYAETPIATDWLNTPVLRFAVAYHPGVHHPTLDGLDEKDQSISSPEYRFSPLSKRRRYGPILREGYIQAAEFKWMAVEPGTGGTPGAMRVLVDNPGQALDLQAVPVGTDGSLRTHQAVKRSVPSRWTGWLHFDLQPIQPGESYRLMLPKEPNELTVGGLVLGDTHHHWPWQQKAKITLSAKDPATGQVSLDFDPASLLPPPLKAGDWVVIDDIGSSVLLKLAR